MSRAMVVVLVEVEVGDDVPAEAAAEALSPWVDGIEQSVLARGMRAHGVRVTVLPGDCAALAARLESIAPASPA